jgi:hypothetical protein
MKRILPILPLLVILMLISCAKPAVMITAEELWSQYQADTETADAKYKGNTLIITGRITLVDTNNLGAHYAMMDCQRSSVVIPAEEAPLTPLQTEYGIECQFDESNRMDWLTLTEDRTVRIRGKCAGYSKNIFGKGEPANIVITNCSVVDIVEPEPQSVSPQIPSSTPPRDFQLFRNEKYGFQLYYPSDWELEIEDVPPDESGYYGFTLSIYPGSNANNEYYERLSMVGLYDDLVILSPREVVEWEIEYVLPDRFEGFTLLSSERATANNWDWLINYEWDPEEFTVDFHNFHYFKNTNDFRYECVTMNVPNYMSDDMQAICDSFSVIEDKQ